MVGRPPKKREYQVLRRGIYLAGNVKGQRMQELENGKVVELPTETGNKLAAKNWVKPLERGASIEAAKDEESNSEGE